MNENMMVLTASNELVNKFSAFKNAALVEECKAIYSRGVNVANTDRELSASLGKILAEKLYVEDGFKSVKDFASKVFNLNEALAYQKARVGARFLYPSDMYTADRAYYDKQCEAQKRENPLLTDEEYSRVSDFIKSTLISKLAEITKLSDRQLYIAITEYGLKPDMPQKANKDSKGFRDICAEVESDYNENGTKIEKQPVVEVIEEKRFPKYRGNVVIQYRYCVDLTDHDNEERSHYMADFVELEVENGTIEEIIGGAFHTYNEHTSDNANMAENMDGFSEVFFPTVTDIDTALDKHMFINPDDKFTAPAKTGYNRKAPFIERKYDRLNFTLIYADLCLTFNLTRNIIQYKPKSTTKTDTPKQFTRAELLEMLAAMPDDNDNSAE